MSLRNLRLGAKQTLGFGFVLVAMAAANLYSLARLGDLVEDLSVVTTNWLPRVVAISDINLGTSELRANQLQYAVADAGESRRSQAEKIIDLLDRIDESRDAYGDLKRKSEAIGIYSDQERFLYERSFDPKWEQYLDLSFPFLDLSRGDARGAMELLNREGRDVYDNFSADLAKLMAINRTNSLKAGERAERTFAATRDLTVGILVATVLLSVVVAVGLVRVITVPVQQLERAAHAVAQGDLDVRLEVGGRDEIGSLAQSFNRMTSALREAQQQLVMKEKMASLGNLVAGVAQ